MIKAAASYKAEMQKHFPNHWPIRAMDFWIDFYNTFGTAPTYEAWEQFDTVSEAVTENDAELFDLCDKEPEDYVKPELAAKAVADHWLDDIRSEKWHPPEVIEEVAKTERCVNETGDTPAKQDSMQAAHDKYNDVCISVGLIQEHSKCELTTFLASALNALDELERELMKLGDSV